MLSRAVPVPAAAAARERPSSRIWPQASDVTPGAASLAAKLFCLMLRRAADHLI